MIHAHYLLALKKLVLKNLIYFGFSSALEILYWVKKNCEIYCIFPFYFTSFSHQSYAKNAASHFSLTKRSILIHRSCQTAE